MRHALALMTFSVSVGLGAAALATGCAGHYHGPYEPHYRGGYGHRYEYHAHRLPCGHYVECRYDHSRGRHRFESYGHDRHDRYWHLHPQGRGYERCYVTRRGHGYR